MDFFSERENGLRPQTLETIAVAAWEGIAAEIAARINDGSFGASYPEICQDGSGPIGTDERTFWSAMRSRIPSLEIRPWYPPDNMPPLRDMMDVVEFCWRKIGKPIHRDYHGHFKHNHLAFDIDSGREEFREAINEIFRRNGLAYDLQPDGSVRRLPPPILHEAILQAVFLSGDSVLDEILSTARRKFLNPEEEVRREALEKLWDAFERIKTVEPGTDKQEQTTRLLDNAAGSNGSRFRQKLETEARELTDIGNNFLIRHSETTQEQLTNGAHVDYVFHRLFSFILLLLRTRGPGGQAGQ